jgi:HK97 family phage major capsid protein
MLAFTKQQVNKMTYANTLREQAGRLGVELQGIVNKAKAENDRGLTADERDKFHKLEADYSALEDSIKIAEKTTSLMDDLSKAQTSAITNIQIEQMQDEFRISPKAKARNANASPYEKAFSNYVRNGERMNGDERAMLVKNTMSTTTGTQGGYLVPVGFSAILEDAKKWFGGIDGTVDKFDTSTGNVINWPTMNDTANKGRILSQNTMVTETDLVFSQVAFNAYIASSDLVLVPLALIEDSFFDLDALVATKLGTRLGRNLNFYGTVGTGTNQPTGIVTAAVAAGLVVTAGGVSTSGEIASVTYSDLVNLEHAVDPAYRNNPSTHFMFSDTMLKILKKLVDGNNRPLWQPGLTASFINGAGVDDIKPRILDHPYLINSDMAVPAASAYSALFGDLSAFKLRTVASGTQLLVLKERYADYLQQGFTAFMRYDSNLVDAGTHPVAVFQQSAT